MGMDDWRTRDRGNRLGNFYGAGGAVSTSQEEAWKILCEIDNEEFVRALDRYFRKGGRA